MIGVISYGNRKRGSSFNSKPRGNGGGGGKRAKKQRHSRQHASVAAAAANRRGNNSAGHESALALINCGQEQLTVQKSRAKTVVAKKKRHRTAKPASSRRSSVSVTGAAAVSKKQEQVRSTSSASLADGGAASKMCENNPVPSGGSGRKRGHQHHPRFSGSRKSNVPAEDVIAALRGAFDCSGTITTTTTLTSGGGGSLSSSSSSSSLLIGNSIVNTDIIIDGDENANPNEQNVTIGAGVEDEDKQTILMTIDADNDGVGVAEDDDDVVNNNSHNLGQDLNPEVELDQDISKSIIEDDERLTEPSDELINQQQSKNNSNSNSLVSSDISNSTASNVIVIDDDEDDDGGGSAASGEPSDDDDEDDDGGGSAASGEPLEISKLEEPPSSGQELVKQISKKLKRSKKSPSSDDSSNASAGRKKSSTGSKKSSKNSDGSSSTSNGSKQRKKIRASTGDISKLERALGDGAPCEDGTAADENDPDAAEWAKLRCTSERTEVIAEREHRRQKRCADYPGLAFGRSIFSSDTMMKFNIIRNELHNIMKTQLKRVNMNQLSTHKYRLYGEDRVAIADSGTIRSQFNDPDAAEWAKLRCTSERTEVIAEREHRRQKRCADYPGLAFGRSIFSSDTMMKFNIIRNELHNIMKTQLKRVNMNQLSTHTYRLYGEDRMAIADSGTIRSQFVTPI
ncbi:hypothetical protein RP20_CCG008223 [Aedes albopictus]|nr:hypothetical protein RP20_CCG008223 [Aedes albopictus]